MPQARCVICDGFLGADEPLIPYKGRKVHEKCFELATKITKKNKDDELAEKAEKKKKGVKAKPKAELKDAMSEEEYQQKKQYYTYLRGLLTEEPSSKVYALTEDYIRRYSFSYEGMYKTLVYLNEIIEKELEGDIVGILPYYYNEADNYYEQIDRINEANKDVDVKGMYSPVTVKIIPRKRKSRLIDIESV